MPPQQVACSSCHTSALPAILFPSGSKFLPATVFLSHSSADREIADRVRRALLNHEFSVRTQEDIGASSQTIQALITRRIDEAIEHGFVLLLLSEASLKSRYCRQEALYALEKAAASRRCNVVPLVISNFQVIKESLPPGLMFALGGLQWLDLSAGPLDDRIAELIKNLKTREME